MKTFFERFKWLRIIYAVLLIGAGVVITILTFTAKVHLNIALSIVIAISLFIIGLITFLVALTNDRTESITGGLIYSSLIITLGVILLTNANEGLLNEFILKLISIFMLCFGTALVFKGISGIIYKIKFIVISGYIITGLAIIACGILSLIYSDIAFILTFAGTGLAIAGYGIVELVLGIKAYLGR